VETDVSRSRGDQKFTKNEVRRLMRLADAQGVAKYRIAISKSGELALIVDNSEPATETNPNPWDEVLNDAAHKERSA
jgi:hypothetical protein